MKNYKEIWKNKARNKSITRADTVAYCILKAMSAKSENKLELLTYFLNRAFTAGKVCAHRPEPYWALKFAAQELRSEVIYRKTVFGTELFESDEERMQFQHLMGYCSL